MATQQPDFDSLPLDTRTIPQDRLNIESKERSNAFPWKGQFSPQLVEALLKTYGTTKGLTLEPFVGSGTVLHEASRFNLHACGAEINPAACTMAQVYRFINMCVEERKSVLNGLEARLDEVIPGIPMALFSRNGSCPDRMVKDSLIRLLHELADVPCQRTILETLIVLLDFYRDHLSPERVSTSWEKLARKILALPYSEARIRLFCCDARELPLEDAKVGLVLTSPPYINVFNYHQQYRRSAEAMGWKLLQVAKSEIGCNRKNRGNRFLTVIQYCLDMTQVLRELSRVCKEGARVIVVVGRESRVRKTSFYNGEIMAALGTRCIGFTFTARQERVFKNRFGELIYEDILHFLARNSAQLFVESPCKIAEEVLSKATSRVSHESRQDLLDALRMVPKCIPGSRAKPGSRST